MTPRLIVALFVGAQLRCAIIARHSRAPTGRIAAVTLAAEAKDAADWPRR